MARADAKIQLTGEVLQVRRAAVIGSQGHSGHGIFPNVISCMSAGMDISKIITKKIGLDADQGKSGHAPEGSRRGQNHSYQFRLIPERLNMTRWLTTNRNDLFFEDTSVGRLKKKIWEASDQEIDQDPVGLRDTFPVGTGQSREPIFRPPFTNRSLRTGRRTTSCSFRSAARNCTAGTRSPDWTRSWCSRSSKASAGSRRRKGRRST